MPISPPPSIVKKWRNDLANQIHIKNNITNRLSHNSYNCPNISNISLNSSTHPLTILTPKPLYRPSTPLLKKSLTPILPLSQSPPPPSIHLFNVATLYVASLTNNADHILDVFNDLDLVIICLPETWLLDLDKAVICQLTSHSLTFTQLNRPSPHRGGGIGILFKSNIKLITSNDLFLLHCKAFSCTFHPHSSIHNNCYLPSS